MTEKTDQADASQAEVRLELSRVLSGTEFRASSQLNAFLRYIVEEELAGRGKRIKERNIAIFALERDADFDPRLDCIVRVSAGRLRRALERYYAGEGTANPLRFEVPKGTYRPVFRRALGLANHQQQYWCSRSSESSVKVEKKPPAIMLMDLLRLLFPDFDIVHHVSILFGTLYFNENDDLFLPVIELFSGRKRHTFESHWGFHNDLYLVQDEPLPQSILSISYDLESGGLPA